jgi:acetate kinase
MIEIPGGRCAKAELVLNKQGGLQALAGTSDFGQIASDKSGKAQLAYNLFLDRLMNYVGAYVVKAQGSLDGIVFSGGIGEKSARLRDDVGTMFEWMGCSVDRAANQAVGKDKCGVTEITDKNSRLKLFVCLTVRLILYSNSRGSSLNFSQDEETQCAKMAKDVYDERDLN